MRKYTLILVSIIIHLSILAQKKGKLDPIKITLNYSNNNYTGFYLGSTKKIKVDGEKTYIPDGKGVFEGFKENSGIKKQINLDNFTNKSLALKENQVIKYENFIGLENTSDFIFEVGIKMNRLNENSGGALINMYLNENKTDYISIKYMEFKKEPYDANNASLLDKSSYLAANSMFKNLVVSGSIENNNFEYEFRVKDIEFTKFNLLKLVKSNTFLELYINDKKEGECFLEKNIALNKIVLERDNSHNVYYNNISFFEVKYSIENMLKYDGNWQDAIFNGEGELILNGMTLSGNFSNGILNGEGMLSYNGMQYKGNLLNNVPNGKGQLKQNDGSVYIGGFNKGKFEGMGKITYLNMSTYEGEWKYDLFDGEGTFVDENQNKFIGNWKSGKFTGKIKMSTKSFTYEGELISYDPIKEKLISGNGKYTDKDNNTYTGNWNKNKFTGMVELKFKSSSFIGELKDYDILTKKLNGIGKQILGQDLYTNEELFNDGTFENNLLVNGETRQYSYFTNIDIEGNEISDTGIYVGHIDLGKKSGKGVLYIKGFSEDYSTKKWVKKYDGNWFDGDYSGQGILNVNDGNTEGSYNGSFKNGKKNGQGKEKICSFESEVKFCYEYDGEWKNDLYEGKGTLIYTEEYVNNKDKKEILTTTYTGQFVNGMKQGKGEEKKSDGSLYIGDFFNNYSHGYGTLTYKNGKITEGNFINGEFQKPFECKSVKIGTQTWMAENLTLTKFRNGDEIPEVKSAKEWKNADIRKQPAFCYYNNDPSTVKQYGVLYNYYAVNDSRGLAPIGWVVPSFEEANILRDFLQQDLYNKIKELDEKRKNGIQTDRDEIGKMLRDESKKYRAGAHLLSKSYKEGLDTYGFNASGFINRDDLGMFNISLKKEALEYINYWTCSYNKSSDNGVAMQISWYGEFNTKFSAGGAAHLVSYFENITPQYNKTYGFPVRLLKK